jgi:hypothetical protein
MLRIVVKGQLILIPVAGSEAIKLLDEIRIILADGHVCNGRAKVLFKRNRYEASTSRW